MSQEDEARIGELLEQSAVELNDMVLGVRADGRLYYASASVEQVLGYSDRDFLRLYNHNLEYADDQRFTGVSQFILRQLQKLQAEMQTGYACEPESLAVNHRDGFRTTLNVQCIPSLDQKQQLRGAVCLCRDISSRNQKVDDQAVGSAVFENHLFGIYVTDACGKIIQVNNTFCRITGFEVDEVVGNSLNLIDVQRYTPAFLQNMRVSLEHQDFWEGEVQHRNKDGHVFNAWVELRALRDGNGKIMNTVGYFTDLSERRSDDSRILRLAFFDPLTGFPNRNLFADRLAQSLGHARRRHESLGLLVLDLCGFRKLNEDAGHDIGDAIIKQVGKRLADVVPAEDTIARLGSDRFAVIISGQPDDECPVQETAQVAEKIHALLQLPFVVNGSDIHSPADMGISCYPADGSEASTLLKRAEEALLRVRAGGQPGFQFYSPVMQRKADVRRASEKELFEAFKRGQFELQYQPLMNVDGTQVAAYEALLRWRHPRRGLLPAASFIELLESTELIVPLGNWVLRTACEQWHHWRSSGSEHTPSVCVNISSGQLHGQGLWKALRELMTENQMPPGALQLELNVTSLQVDARLLDYLDELKRLDVDLLIVGFGAGKCSLSCLKRLPVDGVKIDRSFLHGLETLEDQRMAQALVALAKSLNLRVTVEGIETRQQLQFARRLGCDLVQGFLLSQPVMATQVLAAG